MNNYSSTDVQVYLQRYQILIVDDNATNLAVMSSYLEQHRFEVMAVRDGLEALELIRYAPVDLILLDVMMPKIDGFETCRRLKSSEKSKDIPVIFMTALTSIEDKVKGFEVGAVDYITKPIQRQELLARVTTHLQIQAQRQRLEKQAVKMGQINQDLETMLHVISHDLKEPLRAIQSFSKLLNRRYAKKLGRTGQDYIERVDNAAEHLWTLIDDILTLSRAQQMDQPSELVSSQAIVEQILERLERKIRETGANISVAPNLPPLWINRTWASQAFYNLISNALKYTRVNEPPQIEITPYMGEETIGLSIKDRGLGVPPEHRDRIFKLFHRAVTKESKIEGTGAGLAIVRQIAKRHGGWAWVEPRNGPAGGSEFLITFATQEEEELV
jgi:signal transduction histidine kinase